MIAITTLVIGLIIAICIFIFIRRSTSAPKKKAPKMKEEVKQKGKIYGSMTCKYTVKQIEKYPDFEFIDCAGGDCPAFVTAFPTTEFDDGKIVIGYQ